MKYTITIDPNGEEEVLIYAREKTELIEKLEMLLKESTPQLIGYIDTAFRILEEDEVCCFIVEDNKVFALTDSQRYQLKLRLYQVEALVGSNFIKINQSAIANLKKIGKFDSTIGGTIKVTFKNGHVEYVSRRNIQRLKERLGLI